MSLTPLSTSILSSPHRVRMASVCRTSAYIPADRESVFSRLTVLVNIMAVGWLLFSISSPSLKQGGSRVTAPTLTYRCSCGQTRTPTCVVLCVRVLGGGLGGRRRLCELQVVLALFAHPVRVGAAGVPLDPDPAVLAQFSDDPAQTGSGPVLE